MKYTNEVLIDLPRARVVELFDNRENMYQWQDGLQSDEQLEGEPGREGSKTKLIFENNGRRIELVEAITVRNMPEELSATYEAKNMWNMNRNLFHEVGNQTRWVMDTECRGTGLVGLMLLLTPWMFKRQTSKTMNAFKAFAEGSQAS